MNTDDFDAAPDMDGEPLTVAPALAGAHDMTAEKWLEGFERDACPAREIDWWEKLAAAFQASGSLETMNRLLCDQWE